MLPAAGGGTRRGSAAWPEDRHIIYAPRRGHHWACECPKITENELVLAAFDPDVRTMAAAVAVECLSAAKLCPRVDLLWTSRAELRYVYAPCVDGRGPRPAAVGRPRPWASPSESQLAPRARGAQWSVRRGFGRDRTITTYWWMVGTMPFPRFFGRPHCLHAATVYIDVRLTNRRLRRSFRKSVLIEPDADAQLATGSTTVAASFVLPRGHHGGEDR